MPYSRKGRARTVRTPATARRQRRVARAQMAANTRTRAAQARTHGADGQAFDLGDLAVRQALDVEQDQHGSELGVQCLDRAPKLLRKLALRELLVLQRAVAHE